jgi:glycosyltransferase involved in cell wall biosynthesis
LSETLGISGEVTFAGEKRAPYAYMANADFLVCASRWEGSPNAVLESLACGTPALAFNCPGGTAEIIDPERNGWLVPAEDWRGMGERMTRILADRSWSALKGMDLLPADYRMGNVVKRWKEVLRETWEEKKSARSVSAHEP